MCAPFAFDHGGKENVLVVEDEVEIAESIKTRLERESEFQVGVVSTEYGAFHSIGAAVPDEVLLDATLPHLSGADLCRVIRRRERTARLP